MSVSHPQSVCTTQLTTHAAGIPGPPSRAGRAGRPATWPLTVDAGELVHVRRLIEAEARTVLAERGVDVSYRIGTMIETPRAALTAGSIAAHADLFSFGTNDLTQTTFAISRDDAEAKFLTGYLRIGVLERDPFTTMDTDEVRIDEGIADGSVVDGNEAAARIAYAQSEVVAIYPITPASRRSCFFDGFRTSHELNRIDVVAAARDDAPAGAGALVDRVDLEAGG